MGGSSYSYSNSVETRAVNNTLTNTVVQNFTQAVEQKAHATMMSQGIMLREARDSDVNPNSFPIIIALDLTASMQDIPQNLITTGLPKMISSIIQGGVQSPALLFLGVGDHETDRYPLQVGQFESGDEELDLWLHRTYLEGGGGANAGESYSLAHYFAARHCETDLWDKKKCKGILITIGDEPNLNSYPSRVMKEITGNDQSTGFTAQDMLEEAQERWEVFHINPRDGEQRNRWRDASGYWKGFIGQNYIGCESYTEIPKIIADLVVQHGVNPCPVENSLTSESNSGFVKGRDDPRDYPDEIL